MVGYHDMFCRGSDRQTDILFNQKEGAEMNYCRNCGSQIQGMPKYCENCGALLTEQSEAPAQAVNQQADADFDSSRFYAGSGAVRNGIPAPGYSDRCDDPEILRALQKNKKAGAVFAVFIIPLPLIGFVIYSLVSEKMPLAQAIKAGLIVSAVFLVFTILSKITAAMKKPYEAVVTDKQSRIRTHNRDENDRYTEYITTVQTNDGKRRKIVETDHSRAFAWNYLNIGDRFRFHPKFAFPYERFEKSTAPCLYCVVCQKENPVEADRCKKCGVPLLK